MYQQNLLTSQAMLPLAPQESHWDACPPIREIVEGSVAPLDGDHGCMVVAFALLVMMAKELSDSRGRLDKLVAMLRDRCRWMDKEAGRFFRWRSLHVRKDSPPWLVSEHPTNKRDSIRLKFSRDKLHLDASYGRRMDCIRMIYLPTLSKWQPLLDTAIEGCQRRDELELMTKARKWIDEKKPMPLMLASWRHESDLLTDYAADHWPDLAADFWEWLETETEVRKGGTG